MQKNVIWIVTDQQRAESLSVNGSENSSTPNIDGLAKTGINFKYAISGTPLCCPFRGSMLTGMYPHHCVPGHEYRMDPKLPTIAHSFNENGYNTFYLGKWHVDGAKESEVRAGTHYVEKERRGGFVSWLGYENNNAQYDCYLHGHKENEEIPMFKLKEYETDAITNIMVDYIKEQSQKEIPFFAVMSIQPPHDPYVAPAEFQRGHTPSNIKFRENVPNIDEVRNQARQELSGYYAMVENIDYNVGRIVDTLNEMNIMEDTHIIYFSDHGDMHGSHGQFRKTTPYQEAVNIPFIISGEKRGAHVVKRRVANIDNIVINHVDIAPTTLGLCGIDVPERMEGTDYSFIRYTDSKKGEIPESAYMQQVIPTYHFDSINKPWRGVVTVDGYKYVCFEEMDWLLFDLKKDPYEQMNLVHNEKYKDLRNRLNQMTKDWAIKTEDRFKVPK
ncbi:MAG: sulfatase [Lachnospirales bacterium]